MMIKISPHIPSSSSGLGPIPERPGLLGSLVHIRHIEPVVKGSEFRVVSKISFTKVITNLETSNVRTTDRKSHSEDTSSPAIVIATVGDSERSILDCDGVVRTLSHFVVTYTQNGKGLLTRLVALERVAVVAGKSACPVILICREHRRLESHSFVQWLNGHR